MHVVSCHFSDNSCSVNSGIQAESMQLRDHPFMVRKSGFKLTCALNSASVNDALCDHQLGQSIIIASVLTVSSSSVTLSVLISSAIIASHFTLPISFTAHFRFAPLVMNETQVWINACGVQCPAPTSKVNLCCCDKRHDSSPCIPISKTFSFAMQSALDSGLADGIGRAGGVSDERRTGWHSIERKKKYS